MTTVLDAPLEAPLNPQAPDLVPSGAVPESEAPAGPVQASDRPSWLAALAAGLAAAAAAAMAGGLFAGHGARAVSITAAIGGAAWAGAAARSPRPAAWQVGLGPAVAAAAAMSTLPGHPDALGRLGELVSDAVGVGRDVALPLPFDPGWRPVLVGAFATIGFAAGWIATGARRPGLGLALPLPLVALAAVALPTSTEGVSALGAGGLLFAALCVAQAARPDRTPAQAPVATRALRAGAALAVLAAVAAGAAQVDALFPAPRVDTEPSPRRPVAVHLTDRHDRVLFEVSGPLSGPWRLGGLDTYGDDAWLLRPADPEQLVPLGGVAAKGDGARVTITVRDLPAGALPVPTGLVGLEAPDNLGLAADPTNGAVVARTSVPAGTTYVATALPPGASLPAPGTPVEADPADPALAAPVPPRGVADRLAALGGDPWARLAGLRADLADGFVSAGGGGPAPTPPVRVADLLDGAEGSPYERAAAEALLARWAGVPARVGFGYGTDQVEGGVRTVRPRNGAYWAEIRVPGAGWVPLLDPPREAAAGGDGVALASAAVRPSDEVPVELIVPVRRSTPVLAYHRVRAALATLMGPAVAAEAAWLAWPPLARWLRRRRRLAWAETRGPRARVATAYAEWRDLAVDLGLAGRARSPLAFCELVVSDGEHEQLAWLATRTLYGDLAATLNDDDARAAEDLSRSLRRRLVAAQPLERRLTARLGRASLRHPHSSEVPAAPSLRVSLTSLRRQRALAVTAGATP